MKKIIFGCIISIIFINLSILIGNAKQQKFQYKICEDGYIEITKYIGTNISVHIPANIDGYMVIGISEQAFQENTIIKEIIMDKEIRYIAKEAFSDCINLESIILSKDLEYIGEKAFFNCTNLKYIDFPKSIGYLYKSLYV